MHDMHIKNLHRLLRPLSLSLIPLFMLFFPALSAAEAVHRNQLAVAADVHGPASREYE